MVNDGAILRMEFQNPMFLLGCKYNI